MFNYINLNIFLSYIKSLKWSTNKQVIEKVL